MPIQIIPTNSIRTTLTYWLKCTCSCQSRVMGGGYFPKRKEPVVTAGSYGDKDGIAEDSTAEVPVQKIETEIGGEPQGAYYSELTP